MYLSKLELHGFKSFADRTVVDFAPGVTVVVGPNGCGKSNVVDAVRWVIGEQRARILRSDKMENVIFNGTSNRRALGMSEVLLTIENTRGVLPVEYSEVTIGRRLYRSGESEYLLNGTQCRLKDITDLFMDTGMGAGAYSVIELKMIEELLSDNAADRRRLFEEAAGITKYKIRRGQTLRKLDSTQVDITRVRDLVEELDKRVRSLERQAQKARRYRKLRDRLQILELALARAEFDRHAAQCTDIEASRRTLTDQIERATTDVAGAEARLEALRTDHIAREQALVHSQGRLSSHIETLRKLESDDRLARERQAVATRDQGRLREESLASSLREQVLTESRERLIAAAAEYEPAAASAEEALEAARATREAALREVETGRATLHRLRQSERAAADELARAQRELDRTAARLEMLVADLEDVQMRLDTSGDALTESARTSESAAERVDIALTAREQHRLHLQQLIDSRETLRGERDATQQALHSVQRRHDAAAAEASLLASLLSSYDEFAEPVQFLATDSGWSDRPLETVADLFGCDDIDRPAVEAALGEYASCIVVKSDDEAGRAIARLRAQEKGRALFLVLDRLPTSVADRSQTIPNGASPLSDRVRVLNPALQPLVHLLLSDAWLVDSLDAALVAAETPGFEGRLFAATGEWVTPNGLLQGGSEQTVASPTTGRLGRREQLEAVLQSVSDLTRELGLAESAYDDACLALENLPVEDAERALRQSEIGLNEAEKLRARADMERDGVQKRRRELETRQSQLTSAGAACRDEIETRTAAAADAREALDQLGTRRTETEADFERLDAAGRDAHARYSETNVAAVQARNALENVKRDLQRTLDALESLSREQAARDTRQSELIKQQQQTASNLDQLADDLSERKSGQATLDKAVSEAKDALMEIKVAISEIEAELRELRRLREQTQREDNQLALRFVELQTRIEDLVTSVGEDYDLDLPDARIETPEDFEEIAAREEVHTLRGKIRGLGPVNELALDSFEEETERLEFLRMQLLDLETAESTLMETIDEINTTASNRFRTTFAAIQENFSALFVELFGEAASATVELENPNDPLESVIEIMAKPRGKKPSVLAQLSGGEKTLTAIALLFAIYLVKPSPFCILDEVDAPLDDANIDRFMHLIRSFADSTQFVLVTHNKRTMEAADRMYGITMQEQGISRLVGVAFEAVGDGTAVNTDALMLA